VIYIYLILLVGISGHKRTPCKSVQDIPHDNSCLVSCQRGDGFCIREPKHAAGKLYNIKIVAVIDSFFPYVCVSVNSRIVHSGGT
jgi:hypothetical protein